MVLTTTDREGRTVTLIPCPLKDGYSLFVTIASHDGTRVLSMVKLTHDQAASLASELCAKMADADSAMRGGRSRQVP